MIKFSDYAKIVLQETEKSLKANDIEMIGLNERVMGKRSIFHIVWFYYGSVIPFTLFAIFCAVLIGVRTGRLSAYIELLKEQYAVLSLYLLGFFTVWTVMCLNKILNEIVHHSNRYSYSLSHNFGSRYFFRTAFSISALFLLAVSVIDQMFG